MVGICFGNRIVFYHQSIYTQRIDDQGIERFNRIFLKYDVAVEITVVSILGTDDRIYL